MADGAASFAKPQAVYWSLIVDLLFSPTITAAPTKAANSSPELKIAMETWKEIKFEFDTVDKLDVAHK